MSLMLTREIYFMRYGYLLKYVLSQTHTKKIDIFSEKYKNIIYETYRTGIPKYEPCSLFFFFVQLYCLPLIKGTLRAGT